MSMMRTLVDLPETELKELTDLSRARGTSRAELIRQAVSGFLAENRPALKQSFGLWKQRGEDALAYQDRLRNEWER